MKIHYYLISCIILQTFLLVPEQPITLFAHGIVDNKNQMNRYQDLLEQPKQAFDFPDAQTPKDWDLNTFIFNACSAFGKMVNRNQMNMGHGNDITTLHNQIKPDNRYILYGVSRGGSAIINYLAEYNPTNIAAIITDGSPADVVSSVDMLQSLPGINLSDRAIKEYIFHTVFPGYPMHSTPTVQAIKHIKNKQLPIFIVHSLEDSRVDISCAWKLYSAFLKYGFTNVYLCQLPTGKHSYYMQGKDKDMYLHALHSFYKKYHFNYNPDLADFDLSSLQPDKKNIDANIAKRQAQVEKQYTNSQYIMAATMLASLFIGTSLYYAYTKK